jgi:transposase
MHDFKTGLLNRRVLIGIAATGVILAGINGVPTAITIQKGNVQDKKHIREVLKLVSKVIPQRSLLIFDTGANSKDNKTRI